MSKLQEYYTLRAERLALQAKCNLLEQKEKDLMYDITKMIATTDLNTMDQDGYHAELSVKKTASAQDWPALLDYVIKTGSVDLLQKRLTESAVKARWDSGIDVPGVIEVPKYVLSISKI